ncbi:hypothetical protein [Melittangium boletus]|uniref:Cell division protein FtsK n=1 Tax=Melittangium boletus DSM 14713 TaxID=1294270 RepID=A0A250IRJ7_9BACT|nr:hypothetical protein [Melittangium boletus]ATB33807.1 cell division protein FtsK [Melittangium boletus DSM 14713]
MLVYGDRPRARAPGDILADLRRQMTAAEALPEGILRHAALARLLIDAGILAQGLLDAGFERAGHDEHGPAQERALALPLAAALALRDSHRGGYLGPLPPLPWDALSALERARLPDTVTLKTPEGYAYYALYPEAYLEAARGVPPGEVPWVIGIRGIGTSLACAVVAGVGGTHAPITVRPGGPPFQRELRLGPRLEAALRRAAPATPFALVDEGPGLSGSSFGAVADTLERLGAPTEHLRFFPSHRGDLGPMASEAHRARWTRAHKHTVDFERLILSPDDPRHALTAWVEDLCGPALGPLEDLGGGAWRQRHFPRREDWPGVHVGQERRKYLLRTARGTFLLKFAGLGARGEHALERSRTLADRGWAPAVLGLRHGFLVHRWEAEARPLSATAFDARAHLPRIAAYLAFRARHFARPGGGHGASPAQLLEMGRHNTREALGEDRARSWSRWEDALTHLSAEMNTVETDGRMQAWEWLVRPDGVLLKTDAVDHHDAHDLIGCQDVAWDIVGASVELGLGPSEQSALAELVSRWGPRPVSGALPRFYRPCYLAFQLGHHQLALQALATQVPAEAERLRAAVRRYARALERELDAL